MLAVVIAVSLMNAKLDPEEMVARLLYRDGLMLVIDKPAGIAVHRGPKGGESLEDHFGALRFGLPRAPALAHRLDRETSGCLVLGRHRKALATLGRLFKSGAIGKCYWAVVEGGPADDEGMIDLPLARRDESRGWWMKPDPAGQPAITKWKVLGRATSSGQAAGNARAAGASPPPVSAASGGEGSGGALGPQNLTWLALEPVTGRTHQLRVHCAAQGFPIVRDTIYDSTAQRRPAAAPAFARDRRAALQESRPDQGDGAGAARRAGTPLRLWLAGRGVSARRLVDRRLQPLGRGAIVLGTTELAAGEIGEDGAGARQAPALDVARRVPQLRAHDRLGALIEHALDRHDQHRARRLALDQEALRQRRIGRDHGAAGDPDGLAAARDQEQQGDARIGDDIAQRVDAVVAAPVGHKQRLLVLDAHEARRVAARRAIEPARTG